MTDQQKAHIHALIDEVFALHYEFKKRKDNFNMERYAIQGNGRIARIDHWMENHRIDLLIHLVVTPAMKRVLYWASRAYYAIALHSVADDMLFQSVQIYVRNQIEPRLPPGTLRLPGLYGGTDETSMIGKLGDPSAYNYNAMARQMLLLYESFAYVARSEILLVLCCGRKHQLSPLRDLPLDMFRLLMYFLPHKETETDPALM